MLRKRNIVLLSIALAIIAVALIVKFVVFKKSETSVGSRKADIETTAEALVKSFEEDENAANAKYLNKIVLVEGLVENVHTDANGKTIYLKEKNVSAGVMCSFSNENFPQMDIPQNKKLKIKGICSGYLMDVILNKCVIVKTR